MNRNDVYQILGIKYDDTKENVLNKFGIFRLNWINNKNGYSAKDVDKIGSILMEMIDSRFDK